MKQKSEKLCQYQSALAAAFPHTLPVLTGFLVLGMAYGMLMQARGYGALWSGLMSLLGYGGSMQFAAIGLLAAGFEPLSAFVLSLMVNARHLFYGLAMIEKYRGLGWRRFFLIFMLCDETFSIVSSVEAPEKVHRGNFYFFISFLNYLYWFAGTLLGAVLGGMLQINTKGLDFVLTALFVVLFVEQLHRAENRMAGCVGVAASLLGLLLFGQSRMVIASMVLILAWLLPGAYRSGKEASGTCQSVTAQQPMSAKKEANRDEAQRT